jgi:protein-S-isoprenylcysteine O-methyltransferase Ste14
MLAAIGAALLAGHFVRLPLLPEAWGRLRIPITTVLAVAAIIVGGAGNIEFLRRKTSPNPYRPSSTVVSSGVFAFTRNPMYLSFLAIVAAVAVGANTLWGVLALVILFIVLHFGVVKREERYLSAKFGSTYDEYKKTVRRWI